MTISLALIDVVLGLLTSAASGGVLWFCDVPDGIHKHRLISAFATGLAVAGIGAVTLWVRGY